MQSKLIPALILCAALSAAGDAALAGKARHQTAPEAADKALGPAIMSAAVAPDGSLIHGSGAVSAGYSGATRAYTVTFARPLAGCVSALTPKALVFAATTESTFTDRAVQVVMQGGGGLSVQAGFELIVFCGR